MNKFNLAPFKQSYSFYNTLPLSVLYPINFIFNFSNFKLNFYSYNPPLNIIKSITNIKEYTMSFKQNKSNFIKTIIMLSFSSFAFSEKTKTNENISITTMLFYGLEGIAASLLSSQLTNFTIIDTKMESISYSVESKEPSYITDILKYIANIVSIDNILKTEHSLLIINILNQVSGYTIF